MMTRRGFLLAGAAALTGRTLAATAQYRPRVVVYKNPACVCCAEWVKHMQVNGFTVEATVFRT